MMPAQDGFWKGSAGEVAIHYDEQNKIFHLATKDTSYVLQIVRDGYLSHRYWGKRVGKFRDSRPAIFMG